MLTIWYWRELIFNQVVKIMDTVREVMSLKLESRISYGDLKLDDLISTLFQKKNYIVLKE